MCCVQITNQEAPLGFGDSMGLTLRTLTVAITEHVVWGL